jgi:ubiquinone/menaquinone biosynthesis C-methylase UbiE
MNTENVAEIFDDMADVYDDISDVWYSWLFSRLHYFITKEVIVPYSPKKVLDVGCGTGFQSFLYAFGGAEVYGLDISKSLVKVANNKYMPISSQHIDLFPAYYDFVQKYNEKISKMLADRYIIDHPKFIVSNALNIPFPDKTFDHLNCCGSTLSFIDDYKGAIEEISRVLQNEGTILLEVESRWNMDTLWTVLDLFLKGKIGYDSSIDDVKTLLGSPVFDSVSIEYPFGEEPTVNMPLRLYTLTQIRSVLKDYGIEIIDSWTIHSLTNLIPSVYLDSNTASMRTKQLFKILSSLEEKIPYNLPGCSLVILARKSI